MKKLAIILACLMISLPLVYAEVKVLRVSGPVTVLHGDQWTEAKPGMILAAQDKIKTVENSRAILEVDGSSRVWIKQNSEIEIRDSSTESFFNLFLGRIRAKVRLLANKKFQVKTPVCVASIRGTDLILSSDGDLAVLEGKVAFSDLINENNMSEVGPGQFNNVNPETGLLGNSRDLTSEEKSNLENQWSGYEEFEQGQDTQTQQDEEKAKKEKEAKDEMSELRKELREIINQMKSDINIARELTNEIKESDISSGRTLRDVHGNIVRVEQHLLRPDSQTLQILNLTKRSEYSYSNRWGWGYNGPTGARLDIVDVTMKMNMSLPEQLTEWPKYIASKGDELHPEYVDVKIGNRTDEMRFRGDWKLKGQPDENGKPLEDDSMVFSTYLTGDGGTWLTDTDYDSVLDGQDASGEDSGKLWAWGISPEFRVYKDANTNGKYDAGENSKLLRLYTEAYAINEDGKIMGISDFTDSSENPFTLLKKVAGEDIIFCRDASTSADFFTRGNLDIVFTPDLIVSVAEKLATQMGDLMSSSDNDENK